MADPLRPGTALSGFELLVPVAQGAMATIWAARAAGTTPLVAVKVMLPSLAASAAYRARFLEESAIARLVQHRNVAGVLAAGEARGHLYIAMEWIEGEALATVLRLARKARQRLSLEDTLVIGKQLALALQAAHALSTPEGKHRGIVHGDVCPQNLVIDYKGRAVLVDFGVARQATEEEPTTDLALFGNVPYLSPERAARHRSDQRSDIFSVGTLLYRMATDTHPFASENDLSTLRAIREVAPPPADQLQPAIPGEVSRLIMRCLEKDPSDRPASAAEIVEGIDSLARKFGIQLEEPPLGAKVQNLSTPIRTRRHAAIAAAESALAGVAALPATVPLIDLKAPSEPSALLTQSEQDGLMSAPEQPSARAIAVAIVVAVCLLALACVVILLSGAAFQ